MLLQMDDINSMSRGGNYWPKQVQLINYHAQLRLPDKCIAIEGLVICNGWDLGSLDLLNGLAPGCYQPSSERIVCEIMGLCPSVRP